MPGSRASSTRRWTSRRYEQAAWLAALGADADVVADVPLLLEWHEGSGAFLETPALRVPDLAGSSLPGPTMVGDTLAGRRGRTAADLAATLRGCL